MSWMLCNKLKLNPGKTEFLLIGHEKQRRKYFSKLPITLFEVETIQHKLQGIWGLSSTSISIFASMSLRYVVLAVTIFVICEGSADI